jgi:hypothetical protein
VHSSGIRSAGSSRAGEDLHLDAKTEDLSEIQIARLERSGDISFIKKKP